MKTKLKKTPNGPKIQKQLRRTRKKHLPPKGSCTEKKNGLTLELSQRGGGHSPIQSKRSTFCHRQVPTRISFILPHIHDGASLFIPHKFYPWTWGTLWGGGRGSGKIFAGPLLYCDFLKIKLRW